MQQLLPAEIDPATLVAMRDYMVTQLDQFEPFDELLLRNASIRILIKDATDKLLQLQNQALYLLTELDVRGPVSEEILQTNSLGRENAALKAQMAIRDTEFMNLRTNNRLLAQSLEGYKNILQTNVEREQARALAETQQRGSELEAERAIIRELKMECERIKDFVYRIETERDHAKTALEHQHREFQELQIRLAEAQRKLRSRSQETEKLYQAIGQSGQDHTNTRRPQNPAATEGGFGVPASTEIDTSIGEKMQSLATIKSRTTKLDGAELLGSGSRSRSISPKDPGQRVVKEDKGSGNCTEVKTTTENLKGASVKKPGSPRVVKPIVPLLPLKTIICAKPPEKQDSHPTQETVSIFLLCIESCILLMNHKNNTAPD
ncbi:hypothetical protein KVR01_009739 [Diaporthe batatas]|uniref:uncharacterized protein n=1 Tax=Diaporthe batatas TaxID=748121 RepID=UPI001D055DE9|nr:uncharacterized protein KVR01_009739 [Diaporthe batatas]KAG8160203.1 hypothetical protein KVR01_009739 [Diaporthe batatas]